MIDENVTRENHVNIIIHKLSTPLSSIIIIKCTFTQTNIESYNIKSNTFKLKIPNYTHYAHIIY